MVKNIELCQPQYIQTKNRFCWKIVVLPRIHVDKPMNWKISESKLKSSQIDWQESKGCKKRERLAINKNRLGPGRHGCSVGGHHYRSWQRQWVNLPQLSRSRSLPIFFPIEASPKWWQGNGPDTPLVQCPNHVVIELAYLHPVNKCKLGPRRCEQPLTTFSNKVWHWSLHRKGKGVAPQPCHCFRLVAPGVSLRLASCGAPQWCSRWCQGATAFLWSVMDVQTWWLQLPGGKEKHALKPPNRHRLE